MKSNVFVLITALSAVTVTSHVAFTSKLFTDVAVIVAVPAATPVTTPFSSTIAIVSSLDDQVTDGSAKYSALTVRVNFVAAPIATSFDSSIATLVTAGTSPAQGRTVTCAM